MRLISREKIRAKTNLNNSPSLLNSHLSSIHSLYLSIPFCPNPLLNRNQEGNQILKHHFPSSSKLQKWGLLLVKQGKNITHHLIFSLLAEKKPRKQQQELWCFNTINVTILSSYLKLKCGGSVATQRPIFEGKMSPKISSSW